MESHRTHHFPDRRALIGGSLSKHGGRIVTQYVANLACPTDEARRVRAARQEAAWPDTGDVDCTAPIVVVDERAEGAAEVLGAA